MDNSTLFIEAHKMTRAVILEGDSYAVVFGQCLKALRKPVKAVFVPTWKAFVKGSIKLAALLLMAFAIVILLSLTVAIIHYSFSVCTADGINLSNVVGALVTSAFFSAIPAVTGCLATGVLYEELATILNIKL